MVYLNWKKIKLEHKITLINLTHITLKEDIRWKIIYKIWSNLYKIHEQAIYICLYIYTYIFVYIDTHIHTYIHFSNICIGD